MKSTAMTAAQSPLLPLTWLAGRRARSAQAVAARDSWTEAKVNTAAC